MDSEFALTLYGDRGEIGQEVVQRLVTGLRELEFEGADGRCFQASFRASIASFPDDCLSFEDLIALARRRLREARQDAPTLRER